MRLVVFVLLVPMALAAAASAQRAPAMRLSRAEQACQGAIAEIDPAQERSRARQVRADALRDTDARAAACALYAEGHAASREGAPDVDRLLDAAEAEARRAGDVWTLTSTIARKAIVANNVGEPARSDSLIRHALAVAAATPGLAGREAALSPINILAHQQLDRGDPQAADATFARLVRDARAIGVARHVGIGSFGRGTIAFDRGDIVAATAHLRASAAVAGTEPPAPWHDALAGAQARLDAALGRVDRAAQRLERLARAQAASGQPGAAALTFEQLGGVYHDAHRYREAVRAYRRAYAAGGEMGGDRTRHKFRLLEARAWFAAGRPDVARQRLHPAADSVAAAPLDPAEETLALLLLAREARLNGRMAEAATLAARSAGVARGIGFDGNWTEALTEEALAREAMGDFRGALAATRQADSLGGRDRAVALTRAAGRVEVDAAVRDAERVAAERRRRLAWGWGLTLVATALAAVAGSVYVRTVRRKNAEITRQAEALADANADLAQSNAVVRDTRDAQARVFETASHELRTPLTLLAGPLGDLADGTLGPLPDAAARAARLAAGNADRLARLVDDLLDAARLDAGALPHRPAPADLAAVAADAAGPFLALAERTGVRLGVHAPARPVPVVADADAVGRAVGNLIANALRHTPRGGRVDVRVSAGGGRARVAVSDTGPGVPADALPHLFERFYRADERAGVGTGLGLALAREWAERDGGRVEVASPPGEGATFTLVLPLAPGVAGDGADVAPVLSDARPPGTDAPAEGRPDIGAGDRGPDDDGPGDDRLVVLLAEDNDDLRAYVAEHLRRAFDRPAIVLTAPDGEDALALALDHVPDLVVTDVMMPRRDGVSLTEALKADRRTSHVPVLMLTARTDAPAHVAGYAAGADGYLTKPFDPGVLRAQAAALVAERQRLRDRYAVDMAALRIDAAAGDGMAGDGMAGDGTTLDVALATHPAERAFLEAVDAALAPRLSDAAFGVDALADALVLSPRQLVRKVSALTGQTPAVLLRARRLDRAAALLRAGMPVGEAAEAAGFGSRSGFSVAFREMYGVTPSAFAAAPPPADARPEAPAGAAGGDDRG